MMLIIKDCRMPSGCHACPCCELAYTTGVPFCKALKDKPDISDTANRRDDCPLLEVSDLIAKEQMCKLANAVTSLSKVLTRAVTQLLEKYKEESADE